MIQIKYWKSITNSILYNLSQENFLAFFVFAMLNWFQHLDKVSNLNTYEINPWGVIRKSLLIFFFLPRILEYLRKTGENYFIYDENSNKIEK